jgi:hypothetical protein
MDMRNELKAGEAFKKQFEKLPIEEQEAIMRSLKAQTDSFAATLRVTADIDKAFEPVRQAMRAIAQMPMPQLPKFDLSKLNAQFLPNLELPNNDADDSENVPSIEMPKEEALVQAVDTIAKILSEASVQSDARAGEANSIALSANAISVESLETARDANKKSDKANELSQGANTRKSLSMLVNIACAVISSGSLIGIISIWIRWFSN